MSVAATRPLSQLYAHRVVVAGVLCRRRLLDPGPGESAGPEAVGEDIVHPLPRRTRVEGAGGLRRIGVCFTQGIDVSGVEHLLHGAPREAAAVLLPFLLR